MQRSRSRIGVQLTINFSTYISHLPVATCPWQVQSGASKRGRTVSHVNKPNHTVEIEAHRTVGVMLKPLFELKRRSEPSSSTHAPSILAINGAFTGLALVVVALRVYVRIKILKFAGADDCVIVAAMVRNRPSSNVYLWILR